MMMVDNFERTITKTFHPSTYSNEDITRSEAEAVVATLIEVPDHKRKYTQYAYPLWNIRYAYINLLAAISRRRKIIMRQL